MTKFYTLSLILITTVLSAFADGNVYKLDIDHADRVKVQVNYVEVTDIHDGINEIILDEVPTYGAPVYVMPSSDDYGLVSIVNAAGTPVSFYGSQASFYFDSSEASHLYTITTKNLAESRTSTLTVKCDAPEKLTIRFGSTYRSVSMTAESQDIRFDPATEGTVSLEKPYGENFYGVKLNSKDISPDQYGNYSNIAIADGNTLEVSLKAPDVDYNYTITEMEGAEGFVTGVTVDGEAVADFKNFKAHAGSKIVISGNTAGYIFEKMEIGSQTVTSFYSTYSFVAMSDSDIKIYAHKPGKFTVNFDVDDPENVVIYTGYDSSNSFKLIPGKQDLEFTEDPYGSSIYVNIKSSDKGVLKSVLKNGIEQLNYGNSVNVSVAAGDEFIITTEKIVRDYKGVIYVDGKDDTQYFNFQVEATHSELCSISEGYNQFEFGSADNPVGLGFYPKNSSNPAVFRNGSAVSPMYEGSYTYSIRLEDGDVLKVFINGEPAKYDLSFVMPDDTEGISVYRDHITPISDFSAPSTAHAGTVYKVTLPDAETYTATLGETPLTFGSDNTVEFTPAASTTLTIAKATGGVENVKADGSESTEIYNLQGIRVNGDVNSLPAGIYIIGGKKVYVK